MADFNKAFQMMIANEGGYGNDPDDPGGETYKGIARKAHPDWLGWYIIDELHKQSQWPKNLDTNKSLQSEVERFYLVNFWNKLQGDKIENQDIAFSIFDFGVNAGMVTSIVLAQNVLGVSADGVSGGNTIDALNKSYPEYFIAAFTVAKIGRYITICKKRPESKKYFFGWVDRAINS